MLLVDLLERGSRHDKFSQVEAVQHRASRVPCMVRNFLRQSRGLLSVNYGMYFLLQYFTVRSKT